MPAKLTNDGLTICGFGAKRAVESMRKHVRVRFVG